MNDSANADPDQHIGGHLFGGRYYLSPGVSDAVFPPQLLLRNIHGVTAADKLLHLLLQVQLLYQRPSGNCYGQA